MWKYASSQYIDIRLFSSAMLPSVLGAWLMSSVLWLLVEFIRFKKGFDSYTHWQLVEWLLYITTASVGVLSVRVRL